MLRAGIVWVLFEPWTRVEVCERILHETRAEESGRRSCDWSEESRGEREGLER